LLTTFTNPTPQTGDRFGVSVAGVGSDRVLIGADQDDTGAANAGAAYLFSTNGTLLATFTGPAPATGAAFGISVAAVGSDRVLIGACHQNGDPFVGDADTGAAYLFSTNGTLLTTFSKTIPAAGDFFGISVAVLGSDRVLIGAYQDDTGAANAGAAYLFSTNGTLLSTFTRPNPAADSSFGYSVAAVGSDRVLIGANADDTGASDVGAVYLFSQSIYASGLVAAAVSPTGVTSAGLQDGAVTLSKLDPSIGVWTRSGNNVFRLDGNVGIGTDVPTAALHVNGAMKINGESTLEFGAGLAGKESNAGKIGYGTFIPNALNIVGAGTTGLDRKIQFYNEGGATFTGPVDFIPSLGQKLSLYSISYGIGVQSSAAYFRTGGEFMWYRNGSHSDTFGDPGAGGTQLMRLGNTGSLIIAGTLSQGSDRNIKQDFTAVNPRDVLDKVAALSIQTWTYTNDVSRRHLGPVAQDFQAAFGLNGADDKHITTVDENGVALAAIQGLNQKLEETRAENADLKQQLAELKQLVQTLVPKH
jgi:hypothetical protein